MQPWWHYHMSGHAFTATLNAQGMHGKTLEQQFFVCGLSVCICLTASRAEQSSYSADTDM